MVKDFSVYFTILYYTITIVLLYYSLLIIPINLFFHITLIESSRTLSNTLYTLTVIQYTTHYVFLNDISKLASIATLSDSKGLYSVYKYHLVSNISHLCMVSFGTIMPHMAL